MSPSITPTLGVRPIEKPPDDAFRVLDADPMRDAPSIKSEPPLAWPPNLLPPGLDAVSAKQRRHDQTFPQDVRFVETLTRISTQLRGCAAHQPEQQDDTEVTAPPGTWTQLASRVDGYRDSMDMTTYLLANVMREQNVNGAMASAHNEAMTIAGKRMEALSKERREQMTKERELRAEEANAARKAGVAGAVLDWIMPAVDIVFGAGKVFAGLVTANPMLVGGGVLNLAAGMVGIGAAALKTLATAGCVDKNVAEHVASKLSYAQMGLSMAAAAVDITSTAKNAVVGLAVRKAAARAAAKAKTMSEASKSAAQVAKANAAAAQETAPELIGEITRKVMQRGGDGAIQAALDGGAGMARQAAVELSGRVGHGVNQAVSQMLKRHASPRLAALLRAGTTHSGSVEKAVERSVVRAIKQIAEKGGRTALNAETLSASVSTSVQKVFVRSARWTTRMYAVTLARQTVAAATTITNGAFGVQTAKLRYEADLLSLKSQSVAARHRDLSTDVDTLIKRQRTLSESHQLMIEAAHDAIGDRNRVRSALANALA
ncbi:Secreted effector protein SseC [Pandoraea pneumonica]|jgi:secreted effector protein SseC|uniref:Secreted effector protein SseC n=1 Tax=Pandoraea pneumonica TaxID=2508299 RepID=A0A5E4U9A4_9BURK|nr:type III secretion system translocon subunit SctE [Pandoraea pneumonica]VVD96575.1 Secreted effector protein SseC [Pandoraea pneumonica]